MVCELYLDKAVKEIQLKSVQLPLTSKTEGIIHLKT